LCAGGASNLKIEFASPRLKGRYSTQHIKHELKQANEQRAELLALLRAAVDTEEVTA